MKRVIKYYMLICMLLMLLILSACFNCKRYRYYVEKNNYVTVSATVTHIAHDQSMGFVCVGIPEPPEQFSDTAFKISGESYQTILENGFEEKVVIGKEITFISAPRYFGDGYMMPIVALAVDDEWLLEFDEGYNNLLNQLR